MNDKETLDKTMNCQCLQNIIENDKGKHDTELVRRDNCDNKQIPNKGNIIFGCKVNYRNTIYNNKSGRIEIDRNQEDFCGIPFLFCPICGQKSKHTTPEESYYYQFQI